MRYVGYSTFYNISIYEQTLEIKFCFWYSKLKTIYVRINCVRINFNLGKSKLSLLMDIINENCCKVNSLNFIIVDFQHRK